MAQTRGKSRGRGNLPAQGRALRGKTAPFRQNRFKFKTSRLEDTEALQDHSDSSAASPHPVGIVEEASSSSGEEDEAQPKERAYSALLHSFKEPSELKQPPQKKRKTSGNVAGVKSERPEPTSLHSQHTDPDGNEDVELEAEIATRDDEQASELEDDGARADTDDDEDGISDPFDSHFAKPDGDQLLHSLKAISNKLWKTQKTDLEEGLRQFSSVPDDFEAHQKVPEVCDLQSAKLKKRIYASAKKLLPQLTPLEQSIAAPMFAYHDTMFGGRTPQNAEGSRNLVTVHALNHVFKTRDRVLKDNERLNKIEGEDLDLRDQGFTRPKVLFLLPTKNSCVKVLDSITSVCEPDQQENKGRFAESFVDVDDNKSWDNKPADFRELFAGNDDDMFRLGLKFTRKNLKYFSQFYASDIILASPLGLRTAIDREDGKKHDHDFLSSIEIVVVDHAEALLMQNWEHVEYIFSQLNLLPREPRGCDFSRVRNWYLEDQAKHLRQTIVLSAFITPELKSLYTNHMQNVAGRVRIMPTYQGTLIPSSFPIPIKRTFSRFASPSPAGDPDFRFAYFTSGVLPSLLKHKPAIASGEGTLIFVPSYLDFVRLRNHLSQSTNISFGVISEYTSVRDVARARSHFLTGRHAVLLYTERAHHFRRYQSIRGVKRVIMYALPENPIFWTEVVGYLGLERDTSGEGSVRAIFSKWDVLKLERVVGTTRVGSMIKDGVGDTFDFV